MKLLEENDADLLSQTPSGVNALHMAAQGNQPRVMNYLLNDKNEVFQLNSKDKTGATALIWSSFCGCEVALTFLLAQPGIAVNAANNNGETALHLAVQSPSTSRPANIVKRLLIKGADVTLEDSKGRTAMDLCRKEGSSRDEALGVLERSDDRTKGFCQKLREGIMI